MSMAFYPGKPQHFDLRRTGYFLSMAKSKELKSITPDDYLAAVAQVRRSFNLRRNGPTLKKIEAQPAAKAAVAEILRAFADHCGPNVRAKKHPLIDEVLKDIYGEEVKTDVYSGYKIRDDRVDLVFRRTLDLGLQTIVQLPRRHQKPTSLPKRFKSLASRLNRLADNLSFVIQDAEGRARLDFSDNSTGRTKVLQLPSEMKHGAALLASAAELRLKRVPVDSPNPQISFANYLIGWIEAGTGARHYDSMATLIEAAFIAANKPIPSWTNRLPIEKHTHRKRREKWAETLRS